MNKDKATKIPNQLISETARYIEETTDTILYIFPITEDGKTDFLVLVADHEAVKQLQMGADFDNILFRGYHFAPTEGEIVNIVIRLHEGLPIFVKGVEELPDGSSRDILTN